MYLAPVRPPNQRLPNRVYATRRVVAAVAVVAMLFLLYSVVTAVVDGPGRSTQAAPTAPSTSLVLGDSGGVPLTAASTSTSTTELKPKEKTVP